MFGVRHQAAIQRSRDPVRERSFHDVLHDAAAFAAAIPLHKPVVFAARDVGVVAVFCLELVEDRVGDFAAVAGARLGVMDGVLVRDLDVRTAGAASRSGSSLLPPRPNARQGILCSAPKLQVQFEPWV
ncbi:MAG: hypothetical protein F4Y41_17625 [Gammaproteobacteria bacterium]|nr:hypothetical protein [Gammaproteobacteria bacterium]